MKFRIIVIAAILAACAVAVGYVSAAEPATVPMDREAMYHLQAVNAKAQLAQQLMNNLYIQFINANPEAKALRQQSDDLASQQNALIEVIFKEAKIDRTQYRIDLDKGQFVKVEQPKK